MSSKSKSNFLNNIENIIENVISNNDHFLIEMDGCNVVLITEEEYNKLVLNVNFNEYSK